MIEYKQQQPCLTSRSSSPQHRIISLRTITPYLSINIANKTRYGTLLGTEFFQVQQSSLNCYTKLTVYPQTFVGGIVSYEALSRPQFSQLQQKLFPYYFGIQTALPAVLALTYPGSRSSMGPASGLFGAIADVNRWTVLAPLATIFLTSAANMLYCGPETTRIMRSRKHQGKNGLRFREMYKLTLTYLLRNKRRQEILRSSTSLDRNAAVEQSFYVDAQCFIVDQLGWICCNHLVRI